MNRIIVNSRVGQDGVLKLTLPIGPEDADREVRVIVEPAAESSASAADEWRRGILETAGTWQGDFKRPEQGSYEQRLPLREQSFPSIQPRAPKRT